MTTERKNTEVLLKESEERFRNMANSAPALIRIAGTDKLCTWFNQVWLDFTGRTMEQKLGNGWAEGVHPDDFDRCLETYVTAFDNRQPPAGHCDGGSLVIETKNIAMNTESCSAIIDAVPGDYVMVTFCDSGT